MNDLKDKIIEYISSSNYIPLSYEELESVFNDNNFNEAIKELEEEYIIRKSKKGKYDLLAKNNIGVGKIEIKEKGYGLIKDFNSSNSYYVDKVDKKGSFNGDTVLFAKYKYDSRVDSSLPEAKVIEVLERGLTKIIGEVYETKRGKLNFKADLANVLFEVDDFGKAKKGDLAVFVIDKYSSTNMLYGHIEDIIGKVKDKDALYKKLCFKYDFHYEFSDDVISEANSYSNIDDGRLLIDKNIITIDGDDAKDFDDAISIESIDDNYKLGVYIADVASYVKEDSLVDKEAFFRGTSVYLPNHVIPMLPEALSNDLCSLNEKEIKRVIACIMIIDKAGNVKEYEIKKAYIKSKHRMTYNNVNKILDGDNELINKYSDIYDDLLLMNELKDILYKRRVKRGSLDFESNETQIIFDGDEIKSIGIRPRGKAENSIEEFMLVANETVASHFYHLDLPFIYRVHDEPSLANYRKIVNLLKGLGISVSINNHHVSNFEIQKVLELTKDNPSIQNLVLRLMCKAKYSEVNIGHFGLASPIYTHFTSPIRRYPDLVVHRLIHKFIFDGDLSSNTLNYASSIVRIASFNSSKKERDANNFEYEATDKVIAKYYQDLVGYEFMGTISSVVSYGLFVTLDNLVEGMVHVSKLAGYYVYDEATSSLVETGIHHRRYMIGQRVKVIVNSVNSDAGQIDFIIVK